MGGVSPETCRASHKHGIINFDTLLHLVGFFCMNFIMMHGSTNVEFFLYLVSFLSVLGFLAFNFIYRLILLKICNVFT
jgi:hypothetical protein